MTPQSLRRAVAEALNASKAFREFTSLLHDCSPENANKIGNSLMDKNPSLGLGLLHFSDALGMYNIAMRFSNEEARQGFARQFNNFAHQAARCLRQVPGVTISDNDFWKEWDGK